MVNTEIFFSILIILSKGFLIGAFVLCIWYTYQEDEIFEAVTYWGESHIPEKWQQPIFSCNVCMTPWYGSVIYWILSLFVWGGSVVEWILVIMVAMAFNIVLNKMAPKDCEQETE